MVKRVPWWIEHVTRKRENYVYSTFKCLISIIQRCRLRCMIQTAGWRTLCFVPMFTFSQLYKIDHSFDVSEIQRNNKVWSTSVSSKNKKQPRGMTYSMFLYLYLEQRNPSCWMMQEPGMIPENHLFKFQVL